MAKTRWTQEELDGFHKAAQSLKLYRRAELTEDASGDPLIEQLYVDPLPNNHILKTLLRSNTTFLVGRKGTGKSTIFQRAQHELRKSKTDTSAYLDIKTLFESSQVDPALTQILAKNESALPIESFSKLLLHRAFLVSVVKEIRSELAKRLQGSLWERIKEKFTRSFEELFEGLDLLIQDAEETNFTSAMGVQVVDLKDTRESKVTDKRSASIGAEYNVAPKLTANLESSVERSIDAGESLNYADILMRVFNVKDYISRLKDLLSEFGIKRLYVFIDDYSELPEWAMRFVVDALLAPLNNWSDELVKFKIAAYPGRVYFGQIDNSKIDEIYLDLFRLGATDISDMEAKTIDFTRRLVEHRLSHFCNLSLEDFFQGKSDDLWRTLFFASMGNPRALGYLLYYVYETQLIHGNIFNVTAIRLSSRRYYEEKIEPFFTINKYVHQSFSERSSIYSLKELLEAIIERAKGLREYRESSVFRDLEGRPPTSHFHLPIVFDGLLATIELNFFVTKYYEMSDRDGRRVSVYALNYGLCQK
ncbi:hypothetical protein K2Y11_14505 [bacterium]|nr:hypothetical protein [bacterium]